MKPIARFSVVLCGAFLIASALGSLPARAASKSIVTQSTPSDCGPAAMATLLNYYLQVPTSEAEMVKLTGANPSFGTTLLGLEAAATAKNCPADSFRMTFPTLQKQITRYPTPLIVRLLNPEPHFAVLLGMDETYVYLADPAIGNMTLRREAFLKRWLFPGADQGYVFIAMSPDGRVNSDLQKRVLGELAQGLRNLETMRPQLPLLRR